MTLYLDCAMGAAGDMLMGALLELLPDPDAFIAEMNSLGLPGVRVSREPSVKRGVRGTKVRIFVDGKEEGTGRDKHHDLHEHGHEHEHEHIHVHEHEHGHDHAPRKRAPPVPPHARGGRARARALLLCGHRRRHLSAFTPRKGQKRRAGRLPPSWRGGGGGARRAA